MSEKTQTEGKKFLTVPRFLVGVILAVTLAFGAHTAFSASATPVFNWAQVGGAPFVSGGVHSASETSALLASGKGQAGLQTLGFTSGQAAAASNWAPPPDPLSQRLPRLQT